MKINLGCGEDIREDFTNCDRLDLKGVDVVHNLMEFPYPFDSGSASLIVAQDVIEHLAPYTADGRPTILAFIEEMWRILEPRGILNIRTPSWNADFLWIDVTHTRGFDVRSFDVFDPEKDFNKTTGFYSRARFGVSAELADNLNINFALIKLESEK